MQLMGINCKQITLRPWYQEYLAEHGIERVRNNIDIINSIGAHSICIGTTTGYIEYKDGSTQICKKEA